jgi:hypothetical protein
METNSNEPQKPKGSPLIALLLGFAPAAILISVFSGFGRGLSGSAQNEMLWFACVVSILCCFISSAMLLRRGTGVVIAAGVFLLVLLNCFIAFFFGCCATLDFH